jgi:acetylornithine deacetylase
MAIEPFAARVQDGKMYGRGACDVKGGMAAMLTTFARIVHERPATAPNLVMACTVDEEHLGTGVRRLVRDSLRVDAAVVAEPTSLNIVHAHKGLVRWYLTTRGRACHSSAPEQGVNAIYHMAGLLVAIEQYAEWLRTSPPDPLLGPATLSIGRIDGGVSVNTVPDYCRIEVDRRVIPGEDPYAAPAQLTSYLKESAGVAVPFECSEPWTCWPALSPSGSGGLVSELGRAIDSVIGKHEVMAVPYGTDASTIAQAGIPAVVFGPGDIAQAHTGDEWVNLEQIEQASEILYRWVVSGG